MFVKTTPIPVIDDSDKPEHAQNIIYLCADLSLDQHRDLMAEERRLIERYGQELTPTQEEVLIFLYHVCGWSGPKSDGIEFNRRNATLLDYDDPHVAEAMSQAWRLHNKLPPDPVDSPAGNQKDPDHERRVKRWLRKLKSPAAGHIAGHYDLEVSMAMLHNWSYTEATRQPRLYVQELMARHEAGAKHQKALDKKGRGKSLGGVPADLPEIGE